MLQYKTDLTDKDRELMKRAYRKAFEAESKRTDNKKQIREAAEKAATIVGEKRKSETSQNIDDYVDELTRCFFAE